MKKNNYFFIAIIGISGIVGGFINYLYHPLMMKFMTIETFGIFGSLIGLFNILGVLTSGFDLFLNKEFSKNIENKEKIKSIYFDTLKIFGFFGLFSFGLFTIFSPFIAEFLNIDSKILVVLTGVTLIFSFLGISTGAISKSLKIFEVISINQILGPLIKLISGIILLYLGFSIYGAIIGFLITSLFSIIFLTYFCFKKLKGFEYISDTKTLLKDFYKNKKEIINFFLISLFFAIFMNIDVILVRNLFSETEAGVYAGISVLGKFLLFLLLSIETVYFGQIMEFEKEKLPFHLIKNPVFIMVLATFLAIIINFFFGEFFLYMLKKDLVIYKEIFLINLGYFSLLAFISFFIKILVGWKNYKINYLCLILILFLVFLVYNFGRTSLFNYSLSFLIFGIVSLISIGVYFLFILRKK